MTSSIRKLSRHSLQEVSHVNQVTCMFICRGSLRHLPLACSRYVVPIRPDQLPGQLRAWWRFMRDLIGYQGMGKISLVPRCAHWACAKSTSWRTWGRDDRESVGGMCWGTRIVHQGQENPTYRSYRYHRSFSSSTLAINPFPAFNSLPSSSSDGQRGPPPSLAVLQFGHNWSQPLLSWWKYGSW